MNGRIAKQIRKMTKRHGMDYLRELKSYSFIGRWHLCWWLLFGKKI